MTQPSTLQSFPLEAGIQATKDSVHITDFEAFYHHPSSTGEFAPEFP